jgi:magnesium-transporting ATPase (P-type)
MQIVLLVAGAVSGIAIQQWATAIVLFGLALLNAMMSLQQEGKAEIVPMRLAIRLIGVGPILAITTLGVMQWVVGYFRSDAVVLARSMGLTVFSLASIFFALECNDELGSAYSRATIENTKLIQMSGLSLLATFIVVQFNFMQRIFGAEALDVNQWLVCLALASILLWAMEIAQIFRRAARTQEG